MNRHEQRTYSIYETDSQYLRIYFFISAEELINKKLADIKRRMDNEEETSQGKCVELLMYLLASKKLTMKEIYANVSEILLAGLDTVSRAIRSRKF